MIQRFGGSINLNVHFHQLAIDGVYAVNENNEPRIFHPTAAPTKPELESVLMEIINKITRYLEKSGIIIKDDENKEFQLEIPQEDSLSRLQAAAVTYRFAIGANKGKKALVLKTMPETDHNSKKGLVAANSGFSLHAGVQVGAGKKKDLEKLCRYIARPPIAEERLSQNANGQVVYKLKRPYDDGTSHIVMSPMELMEKLASIVPRPRVHLTRFHGILAPHYKHRKMIVPVKAEPPKLELVTDQTPIEKLAEQKKKSRISWARLLKRIFGIDVETCNLCGGKVKIISAIEDPKVIKKILDHVGIPSVAPAPKPARGPPQNETSQDETATCVSCTAHACRGFEFHQQSPEEF